MTDKVALVTGASRGIGRAVAETLASPHIAVVVNYSGSHDAAEEVVAAVQDQAGRATAVHADVADPEQVAALFDRAESEYGGIDIVVACAGIFKPAPLAEATDDDFTAQMDVNVRGAFNVLREAARRVRDGGRIITLSSTTLVLNAPGYGIYNATKAAAEGFVRVLSKEVGNRGVTVNAIAPGPVDTDLFMSGKSKEDVDRLANLAPQGRIGQPSDIARAVSLLVSPDAAWISGQILRVNGGAA